MMLGGPLSRACVSPLRRTFVARLPSFQSLHTSVSVRLAAAPTPTPTGAGRVVKPRATKASVSTLSDNKVPLIFGALTAGAAAGLGYLFYDPEKSPKELLDGYIASLTDRFQEVADPDVEFMANCLPPSPSFPGYDLPTIFVSVEGVLLLKEWDRKYGFRFVKRPGVEALLQGLTKQGFEIVFWSKHSMAAAEEPIVRLINSIPSQLSLGGLLGREHMYVRDNIPEKRITHLPRQKQSIIILDSDQQTYKNQPDNTLLVPEMTEYNEADRTLYTVLAFAAMYREEKQKRKVSDIRTFLRELQSSSGANGDPSAMIAAFEERATARRREREEQMTSGLGGVLRSARSNTGVLRGGKAVSHSATNADLSEVPEGSLMAKQIENMRQRMREQQRQMEKAASQARKGPQLD